jgi:hypothetical protein
MKVKISYIVIVLIIFWISVVKCNAQTEYISFISSDTTIYHDGLGMAFSMDSTGYLRLDSMWQTKDSTALKSAYGRYQYYSALRARYDSLYNKSLWFPDKFHPYFELYKEYDKKRSDQLEVVATEIKNLKK